MKTRTSRWQKTYICSNPPSISYYLFDQNYENGSLKKLKLRYVGTSRGDSFFAHVMAIAVITILLVWLLHFREGAAFKSDRGSQDF